MESGGVARTAPFGRESFPLATLSPGYVRSILLDHSTLFGLLALFDVGRLPVPNTILSPVCKTRKP